MPKNPNLIPTVITDKTGKVTTVHKKASNAVSAPMVLPAPSQSSTTELNKPSTASRMRGISSFFDEMGHLSVIQSRTQKFVASSSPHELEVIDEAITAYDKATPREQAVIRSIFMPLTARTMSARVVCELLAHRSAFTTIRRDSKAKPLDYVLEDYLYGVRKIRGNGDFTIPLDYSSERAKQENVALLKFAFELSSRQPNALFLPTFAESIPRSIQAYSESYDSSDLTDLLIEYPDHVDDLIEYAIANETSEAHRLRAYIEHEGHTSLRGGAL